MFDMFVYQRVYSVYSMLITTMKAVYIDSQEMYPININSSALPNTIFIMIPFSMPQSVCPSHTLPNISYYSYPTYIYIYIYYIHVYMYIHVYNIHTYVYTIPYIYIYNPLSQFAFAEVPMPYHGGSALDGHAAPLSHSLEAVESLAAGLSFYEDCCLSNSRNPVPWLAKNVLIYSLNNNSNIIIIKIIIIYMCM